jgi:hypothetical protein
MTLGSGDTGDRLAPTASKEAALRSASDREVLIIRALYGFAPVLQGPPVNAPARPLYCCGNDFEVHSTALLSVTEKALQLFWP